MKSDCIFCRIINNAHLQKAQKLGMDENFLIMLSNRPQTRGQTLVIPSIHYSKLSEVPKELLGLIFQKSVEVAGAIERILGAKAYTLKINNGLYKLEGGNKGHVGHIHMHIIPRYSDKDRLNELPKEASAKNLLAVKKLILRKTRKSVLK